MAAVTFNKVEKSFGKFKIIHGISFDIADGEFVVLVGPSGCGKSTLLRMLAGLEEIGAGEIAIDGRVVNDVDSKDRDIAMVFQSYALYPHMTVRDNLGFSLKLRKADPALIGERVVNAARILNLDALLGRFPRELSGGQRQRVAMGRAIVRDPKVFLFDEPLSNLDAKLRVAMRAEIKALHQRLKTTTVYVTHDQVEAMTLADKIVVLRAGHIEQAGTPDDVYNHPVSMFVAGFIGSPTMNFTRGRIGEDASSVSLHDRQGDTVLPLTAERQARYAAHAGREVVVGIRPEHFAPAGAEPPQLTAVVDVVEPLGSDTLVFLTFGDGEIVARVPPATPAAPGQPIALRIDVGQLHCFDPVTERVI